MPNTAENSASFFSMWGDKFSSAVVKPDPWDIVGASMGVYSGGLSRLATAGLTREAAVGVEKAYTAGVDLPIGVATAIPGIAKGGGEDGTPGFFREMAGTAIGIAVGGAGPGALVADALIAVAMPEVAAVGLGLAATVGLAYMAGKAATSGIDAFNEWLQQASTSGQQVFNTLSDGSVVTVNPDQSYAVAKGGNCYYYDASENLTAAYIASQGIWLNVDNQTGTVTATNGPGAIVASTNVQTDANGNLILSDPSSGQQLGTLTLDGNGGYSVTDSAGNQVSIPQMQPGQDPMIIQSNGDGTTSTTAISADGSTATTVTTEGTGESMTVVSTSQSAFSSDGSISTATNYNDGTQVNSYYDASTQQTTTDWANSDGGSGTQVADANGSYLGTWTNGDGSCGSVSYDVGTQQLNMNWTNPDHSSGTVVSDTSGSTATYFDPSGKKMEDSWTRPDGAYGSDAYGTDGSSSGIAYNPDGTSSAYNNDGQGNIITSSYASDSTLNGDTWTKADGTSGSDAYNPDGSSSGFSYNIDGTSTAYTNDGLGNVTTSIYAADGILTGDTWTKADGSSGSDTNNADGSSNHNYTNGDGSFGAYNISIDGSLVGTAYNKDNSYSTYTIDAQGNRITVNYDANGTKLGDIWQHADGSNGTDTFNVNGTSSGASYDQYGNYSTYIEDAQGNRTTVTNNSDGVMLGQTWLNAISNNSIPNTNNSNVTTPTSPENQDIAIQEYNVKDYVSETFGASASMIGDIAQTLLGGINTISSIQNPSHNLLGFDGFGVESSISSATSATKNGIYTPAENILAGTVNTMTGIDSWVKNVTPVTNTSGEFLNNYSLSVEGSLLQKYNLWENGQPNNPNSGDQITYSATDDSLVTTHLDGTRTISLMDGSIINFNLDSSGIFQDTHGKSLAFDANQNVISGNNFSGSESQISFYYDQLGGISGYSLTEYGPTSTALMATFQASSDGSCGVSYSGFWNDGATYSSFQAGYSRSSDGIFYSGEHYHSNDQSNNCLDLGQSYQESGGNSLFNRYLNIFQADSASINFSESTQLYDGNAITQLSGNASLQDAYMGFSNNSYQVDGISAETAGLSWSSDSAHSGSEQVSSGLDASTGLSSFYQYGTLTSESINSNYYQGQMAGNEGNNYQVDCFGQYNVEGASGQSMEVIGGDFGHGECYSTYDGNGSSYWGTGIFTPWWEDNSGTSYWSSDYSSGYSDSSYYSDA